MSLCGGVAPEDASLFYCEEIVVCQSLNLVDVGVGAIVNLLNHSILRAI